MICPSCETEVPQGTDVCEHCGGEIAPAVARLVPVDQGLGVAVLLLNKPVMTIGRNRSNDLYLPHPSVSRVHARVRVEGGGYGIEHVGSRHSLEVNGNPVSSCRLQANDIIKIGIYRYRFAEPPSAAPEPGTASRADADHVHLLLEVTRLINSSLSLKDVLERVIDSVIQVTQAERGFLMLANESGELEFRVARNLDQKALGAGQVAISYSTVERVQSTGNAVVLTDTLREEALTASGSIRALGLRSVMCVPLKAQDRLIGVIYVDSRRKVKEFSRTDLRLFESLASQAAVTVEKSQLYEQLRQYSVSLEDQVRQRTEALAQANEDLRTAYADLRDAQAQMVQTEKLAAIGRLAAGIAHEINSPLGVITSNSDTLYRTVRRLEERLRTLPGGEKVGELLGMQQWSEAVQEVDQASQAASARMKSIVNALKNFVALDQAERKAIDVNEALEATLTLLQHQMGNRIRVVKQYGSVPPLTCSPGRMHQVFMNILSNALQAIEGEGEVRVRTEQQAGQLIVTIEDSGRGMAPDQFAQVFEPGFSRKEGRVGAGLGLAITRQIVQEHQGEIRIESEVGTGTRVILSLPVRSVLGPPNHP